MVKSMQLHEKKEKLEKILDQYDALLVAFSGGVDSTFLLYMAHAVMGENVVAVTAQSPLHPERERQFTENFTARMHIRYKVIPSGEMQLADFIANPKDRCYICKKTILGDLLKIGKELGISHVAHGANMDDLDDYRPGMKAAEELRVAAPLLEAELTKEDIRLLSKKMHLETWDKPSMACLATRIPYGTPISEKALSMIDRAEEVILGLGFYTCRVRHHGVVARIELRPEDITDLLTEKTRTIIIRKLKEIGFQHVALDLEGYVTGSMNRNI